MLWINTPRTNLESNECLVSAGLPRHSDCRDTVRTRSDTLVEVDPIVRVEMVARGGTGSTT